MPHGSTLTSLLHGESTVVLEVVFTRRRDSFAADGRRLRLDHSLPRTIDGTFSPEVNASHDVVTSSRDREFQQWRVIVLVSGADAGALAGGVSVGRGAFFPLSAFRGVAVFRVSRDRLEIRVYVSRDGCGRDGHVSEVCALGICDSPYCGCDCGCVKLCLDVGWHRDSTFADVIGAVVLHIERSFQNEEKSVRSSCSGSPHSSSG